MQKQFESLHSQRGEPTTIAIAMLWRALYDPNRLAFCELAKDSQSPRWFSWGQIANWVSDACAAIDAMNLPVGSHLATATRNSVEWFVLDFACQILGYVHVAIDHRWPESMVVHLISQSRSQLVCNLTSIGSSESQSSRSVRHLEWHVNRDAPPIDSNELDRLIARATTIAGQLPAQMLFTSGTSGEPKGVLLSHRNLVSNALAKLDAAPQLAEDLRLNILPFCHAYARTCELSTWILSNSCLAIAASWDDFLHQASLLQPTLINLVPFLANKLLHQEHSEQPLAPQEIRSRLGGRIRLLQVGGAAIPDDLWHALDNAGLPPLQGYGLTEASPVVCSNRAGEQRPGTIGPPVTGVELRVDDRGQLWIRGDGVMLEYFNDQAATEARIQDGWLGTGDLVERDELGHYRIVGRISEFIALSTGHKVSPKLIEDRLEKVSWIERALLAGEDRPFVVALVWPAWSLLPSSLFASTACNGSSMDLEAFRRLLEDPIGKSLANLPAYMHPRKIIVVSEPMGPELLTPKGSLRRNLVLTRFQSQIDGAYMGL